MEISGKPTEGWMSFVPLTILILVVILALGGVEAFVNTVGNWAVDFAMYVARWVRSF